MKNKQEKLHTNRANGRQTKLVYVIDVDKLLFFFVDSNHLDSIYCGRNHSSSELEVSRTTRKHIICCESLLFRININIPSELPSAKNKNLFWVEDQAVAIFFCFVSIVV